jgi:hypothetical protein
MKGRIQMAHNRVDITGKRYGKLIAIERDKNSPKKISRWICKCDCGNIKSYRLSNLGRSSNSCGCSKLKHRPPYCPNILDTGKAALNKLYRQYLNDANKKQRVFELTIDQFEQLTSSNCYYCNKKPSSIKGGAKSDHLNGIYYYNSNNYLKLVAQTDL